MFMRHPRCSRGRWGPTSRGPGPRTGAGSWRPSAGPAFVDRLGAATGEPGCPASPKPAPVEFGGVTDEVSGTHRLSIRCQFLLVLGQDTL